MVSYDSYKNKILKLAAIKNFIVKFRALFISFFALLLALITAFLITKGMVTGPILVPEHLVYGSSYEIPATSALFSSVSYQYKRAEGESENRAAVSAAATKSDFSEWTSEKPTKAGKYYVRAVTNKAFGKGYGKPVTFEIAPLDVEFVITAESVEYGSDPDRFEIHLINGDKLIAAGFRYDGFDTNITNVCANATEIVIQDKDGNDVTYCYNIATPKKEGILLTEKRVTLSPAGLQVTYAGAPVSYDSGVSEDTQANLGGDRAEIVTRIYDEGGNLLAGTPVNAGVYTVRIDPEQTKIYNGDTDVTARYLLSYADARITVDRRNVSVKTTASGEKEYDGAAYDGYSSAVTGLVSGDRAEIATLIYDANDNLLAGDPVDAGEYTLRLDEAETRIYSGETDVTANYAFTYEADGITVTKRKIVVKTGGGSKPYDGQELKNESGSVDETQGRPLVAGHELQLVAPFAITHVWQSGDNALAFAVTDAAHPEANVNDNYEITYDYGTLTVTKKDVRITTSSPDARPYDGTPVRGDEGNAEITGFLTGETFTAYDVTTRVNAGEEENLTKYRFFAGDTETTEDYEISYVYGKLKIEKRVITVTTASDTFTYNGGEQFNSGATAVHDGDGGAGLVLSHALTATAYTKVKNVAYLGEAVVSVKNVCEYVVTDPDHPEANVNDNYTIREVVAGDLTVLPRELEIVTGSGAKVYDGAPFSKFDGWTAENLAGEEGGEIPKHTLVLETNPELVAKFASVTEVESTPTENEVYYRVQDGAGADVTANYTITYRNGTIQRTKRPVKVTTGSRLGVEYDGEKLTCDEGTPEAFNEEKERGIVAGHSVKPDERLRPNFSFIIDCVPNEVENYVYFIVVNGEGEDISHNYAIEYVWGKLSRSPRKITVTTATAEKVYDGKWLFGDSEENKPTADRLLTDEKFGHKLVVIDNTVAKIVDVLWVPKTWDDTDVWQDDGVWEDEEVGALKNTTKYSVSDKDGVDQSANYDITYAEGDLKITPRAMTITTSTITRVYSGEPILGSEETEAEAFDGRVANENYLSDFISQITNVNWTGETDGNGKRIYTGIENATTYRFFVTRDGEYVETTRNYTISYEKGTLTVQPFELTIKTHGETREYDGTAISGIAAGYDDFSVAPDQRAVYQNDPSVINVQYNEESGAHSALDDEKKYVGIANAIVFRIYREGEAGEETTDNYEITYDYGTLTVTPRQITVSTGSGSWEYDGATKQKLDEFSATRLVQTEAFSHVLELATDSELVARFASVREVWEGKVENRLYFVVRNENGLDISYNYEVAQYENGTIEITPYQLTVTTEGETWEYDGLAHENHIFSADWLFEAHEMVLDESRSADFAKITDVADSPMKNTLYFKVRVKDRTQENLDTLDSRANGNYSVAVENFGDLIVTPHEITVTTGGKRRFYDGTPLTVREEGTYSASWLFKDEAAGVEHILVLDDSRESEFGSILDVGTTPNYLYFKVCLKGSADEALNERVNRNYTVLDWENGSVAGTLEVTRRPLFYYTKDRTWVYDGKPHSSEETYEEDVVIGALDTGLSEPIGGIVEGEKFIITSFTTITDYGRVSNAIRYKIERTEADGSKTDVTGNYSDQRTAWGTLKIEKRPITVSTGTSSKEFDGQAFGYPEGYAVSGEYGLATGIPEKPDHTLQAEEYSTVTFVTEGEVDNVVTYRVMEGTRDVSDNYAITYDQNYGKISRTKRYVAVRTNDRTEYFDGTTWFEEGYTDGYFGGEGAGLVLGHLLSATEHTEADHVNFFVSGEITGITNYCEYTVTDGNGHLTDADGNAYAENYELHVTYGTLTVLPRPIAIHTGDADKVYDDAPLSNIEFEVFNMPTGPLAAGHTVERNGDFVKEVIYVRLDENGNAIPYANDGYTYCVKAADGSDISMDYEILDWGESFTFRDTVIESIAGDLLITKRYIAIQSGAVSFTYDGLEHSNPERANYTRPSTGRGLIRGHEIVPDETRGVPSFTNVSDNGKNNEVYYRIQKTVGEEKIDVTDSYEIENRFGQVNITAKRLQVELNDVESFDYNGKDVVYPSGAANYKVLKVWDNAFGAWITNTDGTTEANGEKLEVAVYFTDAGGRRVTPRIAGTYTLHFDLANSKIHYADGRTPTGTDNYEITCSPATKTFEIRAQALSIVTKTKLGEEYDGKPFSLPEYVEESTVGLRENHRLVAYDGSQSLSAALLEIYRLPASVTNVEEEATDNAVYFLVYDENGNNVTEYYAISYTWGKISRRKREIVVTTLGREHVYDGKPFAFSGSEAYSATHVGSEGGERALAEGHSLEALTQTEITDVGRVRNDCTFKVVNLQGEDESANYSIRYEQEKNGELVVTPRSLAVHTRSESRPYNGAPLWNEEYDAEGLCEDEAAGVKHVVKRKNDTDRVEITHVGTVVNKYEFIVVDENGKDVTKNYTVNPEENTYGTLEVTPRLVTVELNRLENAVYGDDIPVYPAGADNYANANATGVTGETLEVWVYFTQDPDSEEVAVVRNKGTYYIKIDSAKCKIHTADGTGEASDYEIVQSGTSSFEITSRPITVSLKPAEQTSKEFDGATYYYEGADYALEDGTTLAYGDRLTVGVEYFRVTEEGETASAAPRNAGSYIVRFLADNCMVLDDLSMDLTQNYEIHAGEVAEFGYEITKKTVDAAMEEVPNREYNGQEFDYFGEGHNMIVSGFVGNERLVGEVSTDREAIFCGEYALSFNDAEGAWQVLGENNEDETENYELGTVEDNVLNIVKRQITVSFRKNGESAVYAEFTGNPVSEDLMGFEASRGDGTDGFVNGDDENLIVSYLFEKDGEEVDGMPVEAGRYVAKVRIGGERIENNYEITYEDGTLDVVGRFIRVWVNEIENFEYDGSPLNAGLLSFGNARANLDGTPFESEDEAEKAGFSEEDAAELARNAKYTVVRITEDGEEEAYDFADIINGGTYTVSVELSGVPGGYYVSKYETASFTVTPRKIYATIDGENVVKKYDKQPVDASSFTYTVSYAGEGGGDAFLNDDEDRAVANKSFATGMDHTPIELPVDAGEYFIAVVGFTSEDGVIGRNYEVVFREEDCRTLTIEQRVLLVGAGDMEAPYSEEPIVLAGTCYRLLRGSDSLAEGDVLTVTGDNALDLTSGKRSVKVFVQQVAISDADGNREGNYQVFYTYDAENPLMSELSRSDFQGSISVIERTVMVRLIAPEAYRSVVYTGEKVVIPYQSYRPEELFAVLSYEESGLKRVTESNYGLLEGHEIRIVGQSSMKAPDNYYEWLKFKVYDADGNDVTKAYTVEYSKDESAYIRVHRIALAVTTTVAVNELSVGALLTEDQYEVTGELLNEKHVLRVSVVRGRNGNNAVKANVVEVKSNGREREADDFYEIAYRYGLYISTPSAAKPYDGKPLFNTNVEDCTVVGLMNGHELVLDTSREYTTVTDVTDTYGVTNRVYYVVRDTATGETVENFYEIRYRNADSRLIVTARAVSVSADVSGKNAGDVLADSEYALTGTLAEGQTAQVTVIEQEGTKALQVLVFAVQDGVREDVTKNYKITTATSGI